MAKSASAIDTSKVKAANNAYYSAAVKAGHPRNGKGLVAYVRQHSDCTADQPFTHVGWDAIKRNWETYWSTFSHFAVSMTVCDIRCW